MRDRKSHGGPFPGKAPDGMVDAPSGAYQVMTREAYEAKIEGINQSANWGIGILLALVFGLAAALLWAGIVEVTRYYLGILSVFIGYAISLGFKIGGKSTKPAMGIIAAIIALISVYVGEFAMLLVDIAQYYDLTLYGVYENYYITGLMGYVFETVEPFNLVFYAISIYEAYKLSYINTKKWNIMIADSSSELMMDQENGVANDSDYLMDDAAYDREDAFDDASDREQ